MKKLARVLAAGLCIASLNAPFAAAKTTDSIDSKTVYFDTPRYTDYVQKDVTRREAVINLEKDSGTAWITANMQNSTYTTVGAVSLQRGTRETISNTGTAGTKYRLQLYKTYNTGGGSVTINGRWSPDAY